MSLIAKITNNGFKVFLNKIQTINHNTTKRNFRLFNRILYSEINSKDEG